MALCLYFPVYFIKSRLLKRERLHLSERLGIRVSLSRRPQRSLWIHAVSVGEVMSLQNLVKNIKKKHPDWALYFSTLTYSGFKVAEEKLKDVDELFYVPIDFKLIVKKFFNIIKPSLFILTESEFWPNLMREAQRVAHGVLLINGRISSCSYRRYRAFKVVTKKILDSIDLFLVQTEKDKERLEKIIGDSHGIRVAGNLKAEVNLEELSEKEVNELKQQLSIPDQYKIVVAGSTRKGEDKILLTAFSKALKRRKEIKFVIAPRHMERVGEIMSTCEKLGLKAARKTRLPSEEEWDVLIVDTLGELARIYAVSDSAYIGGSLVPLGGQNLLEPAFYSKPVFFGPHMENFAYFADLFVRSGGAQVVKNEIDLIQLFIFSDEEMRIHMGERAKQTLNSIQGATRRTLQAIEDMMKASFS